MTTELLALLMNFCHMDRACITRYYYCTHNQPYRGGAEGLALCIVHLGKPETYSPMPPVYPCSGLSPEDHDNCLLGKKK